MLIRSCVRVSAANFTLPDEGHGFDKVEFTELERSEAQELVEKYNKEGNTNLPPDYKRYKQHDRYNRGTTHPIAYLTHYTQCLFKTIFKYLGFRL